MQSNPRLVHSIESHHLNLDCTICYKKIYRNYFVCNAPCSKAFHVGCMEKMMNHAVLAACEANQLPPKYKCCYCRRSIDRANHLWQLDLRYVLTLANTGCFTLDQAWVKLNLLLKTDDSILYKESICVEDVMAVNVYYAGNTTRFKKPKQAILKKRHTFAQKQPRIHIKQNIGGRRRS